MKPRQIKKNSKSAKDLLIKVFGFCEFDFYYSEYYKAMRVTEKTHSYSVSWEPVNILANRFFKYKKWAVTLTSNISTKELFNNCRKLAKAGVKYG